MPCERVAVAGDPDVNGSTSKPVDLDERISGLQLLREKLDGCIGCGCLSLSRCKLYNPDDNASGLGSGPRYLLGDQPS